jgi:hypothetical protein
MSRRPELHQLRQRSRRCEPGDDRLIGTSGSIAPIDLSVDAGRALHPQIGDHEVGTFLLERVNASRAVGRGDRFVTSFFTVSRTLADRIVVVDVRIVAISLLPITSRATC